MASSILIAYIILYSLLIVCYRVDNYIVNKEVVYIREVNDNGFDAKYPEELSLSLHKGDESAESFLRLLLEKYFDASGTDLRLTDDEAKDDDLTQSGSCIYKVKDGKDLVMVKRKSQRAFHVHGSFCLNGKVGSIEPVNDEHHQKHYFSIKHFEECLYDKSQEVTSDENEEYEQPKYGLSNAFGVVSKKSTSNDRVKRAAEKLTIELLMVIDYAAYSWWQTIVGKVGNVEDETMAMIRQYYAYVFQGIDSRFSSVDKQSFTIDLAFSGLFVAKTEQESYWTTTSTLDGDGDSTRVMVNSSEALEKFQKWLDESTTLTKYDHAILFTGTNLTYAGSPGNTGLAFASSMCRNISNSSIVEDIFDFRTITFATQQVARALGARDDMDNNDCLEFFNFLMSPKLKLPITSFASNKWKFSTCSEQYLKDYHIELNEDGLTCLKETTLTEKYPVELSALIKELPGVTYSGKLQCENAFGLHSDICRLEIGTSYSKMCSGLLCTYPGSDKCGYILPADGTPCGNKKHCWHGSCVDNTDGPESSDTCVFGNDNSMDCYRLVVSEPSQCYNDVIRYKCCKTCELFYTGITGCEYGDRSDDCSLPGCVNGDQDYVPKTCCLTCLDGPTPFARPIVSATMESTSPFTTVPTVSQSVSLSTETLGSSSTAFLTASSDPFTNGLFPPPESTSSSLFTSTTRGIGNEMSKASTAFASATPFPDLISPHRETRLISSTISSVSSDVSTLPSLDINRQSTLNVYTGNIHGETKSTKAKSTVTTDMTTEVFVSSDRTPKPTILSSTKITDRSSLSRSVPPFSNIDQSPTSKHNNQKGTEEDTKTKAKPESPTPVTSSSKLKETRAKDNVESTCTCPVQRGTDVSTKGVTTAATLQTQCISSQDKAINQSFINKIFFKDVARSMQDNQRRIIGDLYHNVRSMYVAISGQLRGFHREYENENESGREGSETLSNDDDDINRKLKPIWIKHYQDTMRDLKRGVREMRYRVLSMMNKHFKDQTL